MDHQERSRGTGVSKAEHKMRENVVRALGPMAALPALTTQWRECLQAARTQHCGTNVAGLLLKGVSVP